MMPDTSTGRILTTKVNPRFKATIGTGSLHEDVGYLRHERTLSVEQKVRGKRGGEQKSVRSKVIVVIEQWICLVLGPGLHGLRNVGICMKPDSMLFLHTSHGWDRYNVPTLRLTAVVCMGLG